jgi:hypothetical protein
MAHIKLPEGLPGIRGPMAFRPETAVFCPLHLTVTIASVLGNYRGFQSVSAIQSDFRKACRASRSGADISTYLLMMFAASPAWRRIASSGVAALPS